MMKTNQLNSVITSVLCVLAVLCSTQTKAQDFAGGNGEPGNPYQVATADHLHEVRNYLSAHFIQTADIDLDVSPYNEGNGLEPIGTSAQQFSGSYDGQEYAISNLYINRPSANYVGLFGYVAGAAELINIGLEDVNIKGQSYVGAIAGRSDGTISQSYSSGKISATSYAGGIAGYINGSGASNVGLAINCYSLAYVEATAGTKRAGGFVGYLNAGTLTNCYASGGISAGSATGGIIGSISSPVVNNCFWNSETSGQLSSSGGGSAISIVQMKSAATFTGEGWDFTTIWEITEGESYPRLQNKPQTPAPGPRPFLISTIQDLDNIRNFRHGHFVQANDLDFNDDDSYSKEEGWEDYKTSLTSGVGFNPIGNASATSFNGLFDGGIYVIRNLYINRSGTNYLGLFGYIEGAGKVRNTAIADASIIGQTYIGAIAGRSDGTIAATYSSGIISASSFVGGIAGYNYGSGSSNVGVIINSYSMASIEASASTSRAGGVTGYNNSATVENCYAAGGVAGNSATGGLVGSSSSAEVISSFWNLETTGQVSSSGGGVGISTWEMMTKSTFEDAGWDFLSSWAIIEEESYPWLEANPQEPPPAPVPVEILTIQELNEVRNFLHGHFKLMNHLDFNDDDSYSKESGWEDFKAQMTTGSGFEPIGTNADPFTGLFDGNGFSVHNLYINRPDANYVGLFGRYNSAGSISKLGLHNVNITGNSNVGAIAGRNEGTIAECYATGTISGSSSVGGITGYNYGSGSRIGLIMNSYNLADVQASASTSRVGGITGYNNAAKIKNCYSAGVITGNSASGGLVGATSAAEVIGSFWNIETSGQNSSAGGGAGVQTWKMILVNYFTSAGWDFETIWGIDEYESYPWLKRNKQIPTPPFPVEIYTIQDLYNVRENLSGYHKLMNDLDFNDNASYAQEEGWEAYKTSMTSGNGFLPIGDNTNPFTGYFDGNGHTISNLFINRPGTDYVGLFGNITNLGSVKNLGVLDADVTGKDYVGVVAGQSRGTISACFSSGSATGQNEVGGIAGRVDGYTSANEGLLINSYSFATSTATASRAGGLVGFNRYAETTNCYAAGLVNAPSSAGGLVGARTSSFVNNSYWNTQTTNQPNSAGGGAGRTTLEMTYPYDPNTYYLWNFLNIWAADTNPEINNGYPYLGFPGTFYANTLVIPDGNSNCYDLEPIITIAGDGTGVILESGSSLEVSATELVRLLDGTIIKQGAYFKAWISDEAYCTSEKSLLSAEISNAIIPEITEDSKNREISFRIFPNPTTGRFTIEFNEFDEASAIVIEISSMVGESIIRQELPAAAQYQVDLSRYQPGIYLVRVIQGNEAGVLKVIKK